MTERQSTGSTPLVKMIKEVYDTKIRMKEVLETDVDDFEQYPVLAWNKLALRYNQGISAGWNDAWHQFYPDHQVTREEYEHLLLAYKDFTPSTPQYSAETDIKNLVVIMKDNYRIRMELKDALRTTSNEFVTYPDICEAGIEGWYKEAYDIAYKEAYNKAYDARIGVPIIVWQNGKISMYNGSTFENTTIYYWIDGQSGSRVVYTQPFTVSQTCTVYGVIEYQGRMGKIVKRYIDLDTDYSKEPLKIWLADDNASNDNKLILTVTSYEWDLVDPWTEFVVYTQRDGWDDPLFKDSWSRNPDNPQKYQITLGSKRRHIYIALHGGYLTIESVNKNNGGKLNISGNIGIIISSTTGEVLDNVGGSVREIKNCCIEDAQYLYHDARKYTGCNSLLYLPGDVRLDFDNDDYTDMFNGCTSLNQIIAHKYYDHEMPNLINWVKNVANIGVFIKNKRYSLPTGVNGIPSGWIVVEEQYEIDNTIVPPVINAGRNTVTITNPNDFGYIYYYTSADDTEREYKDTINITDDIVIYAFIKRKREENIVSTTSHLSVPYYYMSVRQVFDNIYLESQIEGTIYYYLGSDSSNIQTYSGMLTIDSNTTVTCWVGERVRETFNLTVTDWENENFTMRALTSGNIEIDMKTTAKSGHLAWKKNNANSWNYIFVSNYKVVGSIPVAVGDYITINLNVHFGGGSSDPQYTGIFVNSTCRYDIMGSIESMIPSNTSSLSQMFRNDTNVISAKKLYIKFDPFKFNPSYQSCGGMFQDAVNLTYGPVIADMGIYCGSMFQGCTSLLEVTGEFYNTMGVANMFDGCSRITIVPDFNFTGLSAPDIFNNCSSLQRIKCLFYSGAGENFDYVFGTGLPSTGTFIKNSQQTYLNIPSGWTVVDV